MYPDATACHTVGYGEAERSVQLGAARFELGAPFSIRLFKSLLHGGAALNHGIDITSLQFVERAGRNGTARGRPHTSVEKSHLSKEIAGHQCCDRTCLSAVGTRDAHDSACDEEEGRSSITLPDDGISDRSRSSS